MKTKNMISFVKRFFSINVNFFRENWKERKKDKILPPRKVNYLKLYRELHENYTPTFVLSTGRCGTKLITNILEKNSRIIVEHTPEPELIFHSRFAYENKKEISTIKHIVDAARLEMLQKAYIANKKYLETNNRITFFAHALAQLYPRSQFIHLIRHPGNFVRSGVRRKWYNGNSSHDMGRIIPIHDNIPWEKMSAIEKNSWLWNETNEYIEEFKKTLEKKRYITLKAEELFSEPGAMVNIFKHLGLAPPSIKEIEKTISVPVNVQKKGEFPKYHDWTPAQKIELKRWALLANKYNYEL